MASARGMRVLVGGCADIGDGGVPYGPIVEALRTLVRELDADELEAVLGHGEAGSRATRARRSARPPSDAVDRRPSRTRPGCSTRCSACSSGCRRSRPVLFVVEDLHWADPATRETIAFLIRQLRTDRVLLVMTFRADELHRRHPLLPWLAELERSGRVERLDLERLDPTADRGAAGGDPRRAADHGSRRADPSALRRQPVLRRGAARGRRGRRGRAAAADPPRGPAGPDRRAARTGPGGDRRRRRRGPAGRPRPARAGRRDGRRGPARRAPDGRRQPGPRDRVGADGGDGDYAFRHALLQEAAYDDLLPGERQRLHRAFAEALAERGPGSGAIAAGHWAELAYHWSAARDDRRAFEASIRAGEAAARAFAFADARRHDERALELWSTIDGPAELAGIDRVALLDRAAVAAWLSGDAAPIGRPPPRGRRGARPDADPIRVGTMLEQLGRALWTNGESEAALEAHEAAVAVMPADPPTPERARVLSGYGQILMLLDRWSESIAICEEAIAMARAGRRPSGRGPRPQHARPRSGVGRSVHGRGRGARGGARDRARGRRRGRHRARVREPRRSEALLR